MRHLRGIVLVSALIASVIGCSSGMSSADGGADGRHAGGSTAVRDASSVAGAMGSAGSTVMRDAGSPTLRDAGSTALQDAGSAADCGRTNLKWMTARKTNYTSYPDPGSEECVKYNGCMWEGQFAACDGKKTKDWVAAHNIVAAFPDFDSLELHDLCLRAGDKTIVVTVYDTCGDSDCDGCCTENQGNADQLIDIESYTNERWGVEDGAIEWADLGPTATSGCD